MEDFSIRETLNKVGYRYIWKFLELLTILILARILFIEDFGVAFLAMVLVYFLMSFLKLTYTEKDAAQTKGFYNALLLTAPALGIIIALFLFALSFSFEIQVIIDSLRFASVMLIFASFAVIPEIFFFSRQNQERVYKSYIISQILMAYLSITLAVAGYGYKAVLYGYILFFMLNALQLWRKFPFKLQPSFQNHGQLRETLKTNFVRVGLSAMLRHGVLLFSALLIGIHDFAYIFLAYYLGFFLYENITVFLTEQLMPIFRKSLDNPDLFRFNLIHLTEYFGFIVIPLSVIPIVLAREFSVFVMGNSWVGLTDIIILFFIAGIVKGVFEASRFVFIRNEKSFHRIKALELAVALLLIVALTGFGIYGVGFAILFSTVASSALFILVSAKLAKLNMAAVSRDYFYILFSGVITALVLGLLKEFFVIRSAGAAIFMFGVGIIVYLILTFAFNKELYKRFVRFIFTLGENP
jgi:O-antigen/teichoic acid export membrane protein